MLRILCSHGGSYWSIRILRPLWSHYREHEDSTAWCHQCTSKYHRQCSGYCRTYNARWKYMKRISCRIWDRDVPQLVNTGFQVLFHSPPGVLFTFPSQYYALSVTKEYLALRGGPRSFNQGFSCLDLLWIPPCRLAFCLRGFHPLWLAFPKPFS